MCPQAAVPVEAVACRLRRVVVPQGAVARQTRKLSRSSPRRKRVVEIQASIAKAQGDMAVKREEYTTKVGEEKAKSTKEITALEAKNTADQAQVRATAQAEVQGKKTEWSEEQEKTVREANQEADDEVAEGRQEVQKQQRDADHQAIEHIKKGDEEADRERRKAEQKAAEEKSKSKEESSGFFGWLASKAKAFFNKIKAAIKAAFELARKAIKKAIELAKKAAMWAIEQARRAIVAAIQAVGKVLIAIGDRLLAGFPALWDKFRKFIQDKVDKAVTKVNEYAQQLKKEVAAALDALAAGLDKLIGWLEKGMLAVVDAVASVVEGAIKFAEKVAQAIGAFISLIKDVASGPIQWIKNLGAAVVDGIKNHLWKAFKEAVQEWFNSKLEQVLGLGKMVWDLIKSGGLALAQVGKMAWEGIKAMIPPTLIRILVEKLVSMIVPAAGAVMVIIEGLQAAWGTVQRIIAAFQRFFAFLKAVKTGNAGPPFAQALAAAAVAVIDFVANWLILKLAKGAAKVGGKIKGLAKKLLGRKKGRALARKVKAKAKPAKKPKPKKPVKPPKAKKPKKGKDKKADKKQDKERQKRERLQKAVQMIRPKLQELLAKGVRGIRLTAELLMWRARYRLSRLTIEGSKNVRIVAKVNPEEVIVQAREAKQQEVARIIREVGRKVMIEAEKRKDSTFPKAAKMIRETKVGTETTTTISGEDVKIAHELQGPKVLGLGTYPGIARKLAGIDPKAMAAELRSVAATGGLTGALGPKQGVLAAKLAVLMFGVEAARTPAALATSMMTVDLIQKGELDWKQAFMGKGAISGPRYKAPSVFEMGRFGGGGKYPMSMEGAQPAAKAADIKAGTDMPAGKRFPEGSAAAQRELEKREFEMVEKWVLATEGTDIFSMNEAQIREKIENAVRRFYKMI